MKPRKLYELPVAQFPFCAVSSDENSRVDGIEADICLEQNKYYWVANKKVNNHPRDKCTFAWISRHDDISLIDEHYHGITVQNINEFLSTRKDNRFYKLRCL